MCNLTPCFFNVLLLLTSSNMAVYFFVIFLNRAKLGFNEACNRKRANQYRAKRLPISFICLSLITYFYFYFLPLSQSGCLIWLTGLEHYAFEEKNTK